MYYLVKARVCNIMFDLTKTEVYLAHLCVRCIRITFVVKG